MKRFQILFISEAQREDVAAEAARDVAAAGATSGGEAGVERGRGESRPSQRMARMEAGSPRLKLMGRRRMGMEVLILQRKTAMEM